MWKSPQRAEALWSYFGRSKRPTDRLERSFGRFRVWVFWYELPLLPRCHFDTLEYMIFSGFILIYFKLFIYNVFPIWTSMLVLWIWNTVESGTRLFCMVFPWSHDSTAMLWVDVFHWFSDTTVILCVGDYTLILRGYYYDLFSLVSNWVICILLMLRTFVIGPWSIRYDWGNRM